MYGHRQDDTLYIMTYTLNSGIKGTVPLSNQQIQEWLECYRIGKKFVTGIGKEYFGLHAELVADFKVHNQYSSYQEVIIPVQQPDTGLKELSQAYKSTETLIKVDCKCGTSYVTESPFKRTKWYCTKCREIVFLDNKKGMVDTSRGKAHFMTNKYFVERETTGV
ncbi:hypothetical protein [Paenibacillus sp. NPDC055715]